ncbi:MAG: shikimate dehydrogenase [Spirochaetia bacterium]
MLCLTLTGSALRENLKTAVKYRDKADILELRIDLLNRSEYDSAHSFPGLLRNSMKNPPRLICTVRRETDGGKFRGTESERVRLIASLADAPAVPDYIDMEEDFSPDDLTRTLRNKGITIIRSFHDFTGVPIDLTRRINSLTRREDEIPKAAVMPESSAAFLDLIKAYRELGLLRNPRRRKVILLGMGEYGIPTRILAPLLGSWITFCSPPGTEAAPGHADPDLLLDLYRYGSINTETDIFGVIGYPVAHSRSPHFHNPRFRERGRNAVYLPFLVDSVTPFLESAEILNIQGLSVTIPHKKAVIPHISACDDTVRASGACNTMYRSGGAWRGTNTDIPGFLAPLEGITLKNMDTAVIGAGGAARGIIWALIGKGAKVTVYNRTPEKARKAAEELSALGSTEVTGRHLDDLGAGGTPGLIVQCTSVGMHPRISEDPVPGYRFRGSEIVYDIIYTPVKTAFIKRAEKSGCRIITGDSMFTAQAEQQFSLFSGSPS